MFRRIMTSYFTSTTIAIIITRIQTIFPKWFFYSIYLFQLKMIPNIEVIVYFTKSIKSKGVSTFLWQEACYEEEEGCRGRRRDDANLDVLE